MNRVKELDCVSEMYEEAADRVLKEKVQALGTEGESVYEERLSGKRRA